MSVVAASSLEQFLANPTKPASEFVEGEVRQKPVPSELHSELQVWLSYLLLRAVGFARNRVRTEQDVQLGETTVRVPDICVVERGVPATGRVVEHPPLLCVEIVSPSDRLTDTVKKCQSYLRWGVAACWILNPETEEAWTVRMESIEALDEDGELRAGEIAIPLQEVFQPRERS